MQPLAEPPQALGPVEIGVRGVQQMPRRMVDVDDDRVEPLVGGDRVELRGGPRQGEEVAVDQSAARIR
jgi:hypothetical protein